jgi:hypothetical protein
MLLFSRKTLLAVFALCLVGCPKKSTTPEPASPITPPEEKASLTPDTPQEAPKADPAGDLAPTANPDASQAAPQEAPANECGKPKDCKVKGKPGKGMRWTCFESRCMAEPKGGLKKKKKKGKG